MKFHPASRRELRRISLFSITATMLLIAVAQQLSAFDYRTLIGAIGGCIVAVLNFSIMCLTIQKAVEMDDQKARQALIQGSYNGRLLLQAGWIAAAFAIPQINVLSASIPLLFPGFSIFLSRNLNKKTV